MHRADVIEKLVKGGFVEEKGKQLIPTKDGINLVCVLSETPTFPKLTVEWENNLTQIAKGKADLEGFMQGIEEIVLSFPTRKKTCSSPSTPSLANANAPAAALPPMRERKTITVLTKSATSPCGRTTDFLKNRK